MEHHADFAVPIAQKLEVSTRADPGDGLAPIRGRVIAIGWWIDPDAGDDPDHEPAGTLYLIADQTRTRPYWINQRDLLAVRLID